MVHTYQEVGAAWAAWLPTWHSFLENARLRCAAVPCCYGLPWLLVDCQACWALFVLDLGPINANLAQPLCPGFEPADLVQPGCSAVRAADNASCHAICTIPLFRAAAPVEGAVGHLRRDARHLPTLLGLPVSKPRPHLTNHLQAAAHAWRHSASAAALCEPGARCNRTGVAAQHELGGQPCAAWYEVQQGSAAHTACAARLFCCKHCRVGAITTHCTRIATRSTHGGAEPHRARGANQPPHDAADAH